MHRYCFKKVEEGKREGGKKRGKEAGWEGGKNKPVSNSTSSPTFQLVFVSVSKTNTRHGGLLINNKTEFKQSNSQCGKFHRTNGLVHK